MLDYNRDYNEKVLLLTKIIKKFLKEERSYNPEKVKLYRGDRDKRKLIFFTSYIKDLKYQHIIVKAECFESRLSKVQIMENSNIVFIKEGKSLKQYLMEIKLEN